jgi:hypothetical protein
MFWIFILVAVLALMFVKLGVYSVWVTVLSAGLKLAVLVIAFLLIALAWRKYFRAKND